jgi:hypothetical protein
MTATLVAALRGPMTILGIANPRSWAASDWGIDAIPHLAYAIVAGLVADVLDG